MKIYRFFSVISAAGALFMFLAGCATRPPVKAAPLPEERKPSLLQTPANAEGSLWSTRTNVNYFADVKARNVGDIVTINVVESASASKNAETKTSRSSDLSASWTGVLAKMTGGWVGSDQSVDFANNFDGKGATTRSSTLNTYITATVIHVFPNGNLAIQGTRQVQVNNEDQYINIQGVIRPADISANNIVLSTFISDARIELSGQGSVSDKQRPGWLARVLDWVWPF